MGFWRIVFIIILPLPGVLLGKGFGWAFILNIVLTLLGYIPGLIHTFWIQARNQFLSTTALRRRFLCVPFSSATLLGVDC